MKKVILYICVFFPASVFGNTFTQVEIDNHTLQYISYNISSEIYDIQIGLSSQGSHLREIMGNYGGVSAINGVFFCPVDYPQCKGKNSTINERFIQGKELSTYKSTGERVVFGWNQDIESFLYQTDKINAERRDEIYEGFANFPLLLQSGENKLEHYYDIGLIDHKMRTPLTRHFICTDESRSYIHFGRVTRANLDDVVGVISKIGCYDAINLDAGGSSSFIYNGRNLVGPGRDVLDGVIITRNDIDVQKINSSINRVFVQINAKYIKKRNTQKSIENLQGYRDAITQARRKIYQKYSTDIIDAQAKNIGYSIDVTSTADFKKIYILNTIDNKIKELISILQNPK